MSEISSLEEIFFDGGHDYYNSSKRYDSEEEGNIGESTSMMGEKDECGIDYFDSDSEFEGEETTEDISPNSDNKKEYDQRKRQTDFGNWNCVSLLVFSRKGELCSEVKTKITDKELRLSEFKKLRPPLDTPFPSLGILKNFGTGLSKHLTGVEVNSLSCYTERIFRKSDVKKLSTGDVLRAAGEKFIQLSSVLGDPFGISFDRLSGDEKLDVKLVQNLLSSAEKIGQQNYISASAILSQCDDISSQTGNPVQRLVYYYSEALQDKINRETGKVISNGFNKKLSSLESEEALMILNPVSVALDERLPHCQLCIHTAMQSIIDNVSEAKKVHIVDLKIRSGLQYAVLMQALANRSEYPIEHLKITAVGTKFKDTIEKTSKWLTSFAKSMNLPFSFNIVMVSDMLDIKLDFFEVEEDETVAIYSSFALGSIIGQPDRLESFMRVLRSMKPCLMVLTEVEASHTSPVFVKRFTESLFFFGAYFDCFEECMDPNDPHRTLAESMYFGPGIRNLIAAESGERTFRHVTMSVWRVFFARFWMVEEQLSPLLLYQASLVLNKFSCWSLCSLVMDKKSLLIGWKGTPQISISAWKFLKS